MRRAALLVVALAATLAPGTSNAAATPLRTHVSPSAVAVGDVFVYSVVVPVPAGVDADTIEIAAPTGPFTTMAAAERTTTTDGGPEVVELRQSLACLAEDCVPLGRPRRASLPPATAVVGRARITSRPVVLEISPRVPAAAVDRDEPVLRSGPLLSGDGERALSATALAVAGGGALLLGLLVLFGRRPRPAARRRVTADPIERARRLLLASVTRSPTARRRAASLAGRLAPDEGLAHDAQRIAWSPHDPTGEDAVALAGELATQSDVGR